MKIIIPLLIWLFISQVTFAQSHSNLPTQANQFILPNGEMASTFSFSKSIFSNKKNKSNTIEFELPTPNGIITLLLEPNDILHDGFSVVTKNCNGFTSPLKVRLGDFYKGQIKDRGSSSVSLYVQGDRISGVVHTGNSTLNIGYNKIAKKHVVFEHFISEDMPQFTCNELGEYSKRKRNVIQKSFNSCNNAVSIYYECDYDMYTYFNDTDSLLNYVLSTFNEVANIYNLENIPLQISQIAIWSEDDPYQDNASGIYDFADSLIQNSFPGDVAQLLTNDPGQNGGTAYVDQLCGLLPFGYCDLINSSEIFPTYSWDVQVMAHELGHTFGSQHTHDCVWGPNGDTQIDDCGNVLNGGGACYDPSGPMIPANGGTVMSYCHLDPVGINFANGFGLEPGTLMRVNHQSCFCDNSQCSVATEITTSGEYYAHPSDGNGASSSNASHADWFVISPTTASILSINSCGEGVDTRVWIWEGNCEGLIFKAISDDQCDSGSGNQYASSIENLELESGLTYYIEWDNRWSSNAFNWNLSLEATNICDDINVSTNGMLSDTTLNAEMILSASSTLQSNSSILFGAGESIELLPGFQMELGATLLLNIEGCVN